MMTNQLYRPMQYVDGVYDFFVRSIGPCEVVAAAFLLKKDVCTSFVVRGLPFNIQGGGGQGYWDGPEYFFQYDPAHGYFFSSCTVNKLFISTTFETTFINCRCIIY